MRELPILYSPDMVRAKLAGRKTQTRRVMKKQADDNGVHDHTRFPLSIDSNMQGWWGTDSDTGELKRFWPKCHAGDVLYVKERFTQNGLGYYRYYADWDDPTKGPFIGKSVPEKFRGKWKNSLFMPKEAARIWERVTNVRVERLHDITEADAIAEGVEEMPGNPGTYRNYLQLHGHLQGNAVESYFTLWISIYGRESFDSNPWVWVYETELLSTTGKPDNL